MFSKPSQKPQSQQQVNLENAQISTNPLAINQEAQQDTLLQIEEEKSELVVTAEKISRIVSPYFIVVIGLALSEKNFLIGSILILLGIIYLLKVSAQDVASFFEWLKDFLGLSNTHNK